MLKSVNYTGVTTSPPDNEAQEGDLMVAHNMIQEDGALRPIFPPKLIFKLPENRRVVFIHEAASFTDRHYFIYDDNTHALFWQDGADGNTVALADDTFPGFLNITAIGNILLINFSGGIGYMMYKEGAYKYLGTKLPTVNIGFTLGLAATATFGNEHSIPYVDSKVDKKVWMRGNGSGAVWGAKNLKEPAAQAVIGDIVSSAATTFTEKGYFWQPFFVRYALKLFDGSYVCHSAPILMLPSVIIPLVRTNSLNFGDESFTFKTSGSAYGFRLFYACMQSDFEALARWKDIVESVDFFVSAPIYTFSQADPVKLTLDTSTLAEYEYVSGLMAEESRSPEESRSDWRPPTSVSPSSGDWLREAFATTEFYCTPSASAIYFPVPRNSEYIKQLTSCSQFYFAASLDIDQVLKWSNLFSEIPMEECNRNLTNLTTRPTLPDDYLSQAVIKSKQAFVYNSRLNLANVELTLPQPFYLRTSAYYCNPLHDSIDVSGGWADLNAAKLKSYVSVSLVKDNRSCETVRTDLGGEVNITSPGIVSFDTKSFPRFLFYPDASATRMRIKLIDEEGNETCYDIPLKPHPTLNGAYWFRGFGTEPPPTTVDNYFSQNNVITYPNKIYTSEVNNPFVFKPTYINSVGDGAVLGISAAVKALSQGQFGQFPLYAFTSEGVWALSVNEVGVYSAVQPVSREVCSDAASITQLDTAVAFASTRGLIILQGSETTCISDIIERSPFVANASLPDLDINVGGQTPMKEYRKDYRPFNTFRVGANMVFDYHNQRLIVYRTDTDYAYVYSLRSGKWSMMDSAITASVNSYPESLVMIKHKVPPVDQISRDVIPGWDNKFVPALADLSLSDANSVECQIVTRPISLDAENAFKTFRSMLHRGALTNPHNLRTIIFASRDLYHWVPVAGKYGSRLKCCSGTPYKYFVFDIRYNASPTESLSGFDVEFIPKFTNRLR